MGNQHCIGLKAGLLRDQGKDKDRGGQGQVDEGRSKAGVTGPAFPRRSTCVSQCAIRGELASSEIRWSGARVRLDRKDWRCVVAVLACVTGNYADR